MNNIDILKQRLLAYRTLPEPHYQSVGEHLLSIVKELEADLRKEATEQKEKIAKAFIKEVDKLCRSNTNQTVIEEGDYVYTITATKVHKSISESTTPL